MDSQFFLRWVMMMGLVQFQSRLSVLMIFQQSGVESSCTVIPDSALGSQNLSGHGGEMESRFLLDVFQCLPCLHLKLRTFGALFNSIKLSQNINFLLRQTMAGLSVFVRKLRFALFQAFLMLPKTSPTESVRLFVKDVISGFGFAQMKPLAIWRSND